MALDPGAYGTVTAVTERTQHFGEFTWKNVKPHADWLLDEANRTIEVHSKAIGEHGIWGNAKVERLDAEGDLVEERSVG